MPGDYENAKRKAAVVGLGVLGGFVGVVVGGAIAGPIGMVVGAAVGVAIGVGVGVALYIIYNEKAEVAQEREALIHERAQWEVELVTRQAQQEAKMVSRSASIEREAEKVKATKKAAEEIQRQTEASQRQVEERERKTEKREAIIDQKLSQLAIDKINIVKDYIDSLKLDGVSAEKIKERVKARRNIIPSFKNVFFEDDLRDAKTDALLDDCVRAPDGYYYNRSTLVDIYQQAMEKKIAPVCFKDPSKPLPNPVTLPTDQGFRATIQALRKAGLAEGLSLSSLPKNPESMNPVRVAEDPTLIEKISMPSQDNTAHEKTFLRAPKGYCAFFITEQALASPEASTTAEPTDVAVVVERQALQGING